VKVPWIRTDRSWNKKALSQWLLDAGEMRLLRSLRNWSSAYSILSCCCCYY